MGTNEQKQQKEQKEQSCKAPWQAWVEAFGSGKEGGRFGPPGCCTHFFGAFHQAASGQQEQTGEEEPESSGARAAPMGKGCCVPPFFGPGAAKEDAPRKEVHSADDIRQAVREVYSRMAESGTACGCDPGSPGSAGPDTPSRSVSEKMGYSEEELGSIPEGADMGLGCGNPQAIAALLPGETVLDLGSGGGLDCFLAARQVGETGRVIGVDMTPKMLRTARANAEKSGATNVEFRLGEIEHLPVADGSVDAVISNCVINLSPDKPAVYREAYRVLKPGGRIAISDIVATAPLPDEIRSDLALHAGCIAGAAEIGDLERMLSEIGFEEVRITPSEKSRELISEWMPGRGIEDCLASAAIEAVKPA